MPIYEYECQSCKSRFEKLVKTMSEPAGVECPKCGSTRTDKALSAFAVTSAPSHSPAPRCQGCPGGGSCPMMD